MTDATTWATLGVSTVYEAAGQKGLLDNGLQRIIAGSRAAGSARTVVCGQADNEGIHHAIDLLEVGEVLVATTPRPEPVALFGEVLGTFAKARGAAAVLIDGGVRDVDELVALGLPVWARWVTSAGPGKGNRGIHGEPVSILGQRIAQGDLLVLDGDGVIVVQPEHESATLEGSLQRAAKETDWLPRLRDGESTVDLMGLRAEQGSKT